MQHHEDAALGVRLHLLEVVARTQRAELVDGALQPGRLDGLRDWQSDLRQGGFAVDLGRLAGCAGGTRRAISARVRSSSSRDTLWMVRSVSASATPQPMSTPMAYGTTARSAKSTPPMGMP